MKKINVRNPKKPNLKNHTLRKKSIKAELFISVTILSLMSFACGNKEGTKKYNEVDALVHSHVYIQKKLSSPGSAEFESGTDGVKKINDTTFTVNSYVDSQNKFGALLRSEYSLKVIFHPKTDTHDIVDAVIK